MKKLYTPENEISKYYFVSDLIKFFQAIDKTETVHQNANRTHDRGLININLIGRRRDVIPPGRANLIHDGINRDLGMQGAQTTNLVINLAGMDGASTRRYLQPCAMADAGKGRSGYCGRTARSRPTG